MQSSFLIRSFINNNTNHDQKNSFKCEANAQAQNPSQIQTVLLLIKNLFELRQYKKCVHILKEYRHHQPDNQSVIFYYYYSIWMNGLIRKEEEIYENCNERFIQKIVTKFDLTLKSNSQTENSKSYIRKSGSTGSTSTFTG